MEKLERYLDWWLVGSMLLLTCFIGSKLIDYTYNPTIWDLGRFVCDIYLAIHIAFKKTIREKYALYFILSIPVGIFTLIDLFNVVNLIVNNFK